MKNELFVRIKVSELSLDDEFMKYNPATREEKRFKASLSGVICRGVADFEVAVISPSFTDDGDGICFKPGSQPAVGKTFKWWWKKALEFDPERRSRLGTKSEYIAYMGVLIKTLVANGWNVEKAWRAVCWRSEELGHYENSEDAKKTFEPTGSRCVFGFFDLANVYKILVEEEEGYGYWRGSGMYSSHGAVFPLTAIYHVAGRGFSDDRATGWIVREV